MRRSKNFEKNSKTRTEIQKSNGSTGYSSTSGDEDNETCEMVELDDNELVFMTEQLNR